MTRKRVKKPTTPRPAPTHGLPLVLYASKVADTFIARAVFKYFEDGDRIGVYELREVRTLTVTRGLR